MAILTTDDNNVSVTSNNGKVLLRTSGSVLDYRFNRRTTSYTFTASNQNFNLELPNMRSTITPKSTSSRFLIIVTINGRFAPSSFMAFNIRRYINNVFNTETQNLCTWNDNSNLPITYEKFTFSYIDHPNTTSTVQYRVGCSNSGNTVATLNISGGVPTIPSSSMAVLELA